jgi:pSer/pThr/pTyr-binding forkhead associated (FHA) protein
MLKHYIFWGLFALVLIAAIASVLRQVRRERKARAAQAAAAPAAANAGDSPAARPAPAAFDPNATRIHHRAAATATAAPQDRDEATLPSGRSARLVCVGGIRKGESFAIAAAGIKVGRDALNDIVIADPRVSHHHAWIGIIDHKVVLRDLDSTNGTFLNAHLDALVHEAVLCPGDTIFFGGHGGNQFRLVFD